MLRKVVFPAATAPIWNGVRYGLTHAWLALVVCVVVTAGLRALAVWHDLELPAWRV